MMNLYAPVRILIADDCPQVCSALKLLLETEGHWKVVGEAADFSELQKVYNQKIADLVLLDWELPGFVGTAESAAETISMLQGTGAETRVVAFSGYDEAGSEAKEAGVDAFISKIEPPEKLISVLRSVES